MHLAGQGAILKASNDAGEGVVIHGVVVVDDHLGQQIVAIQQIHVSDQGLRLGKISNAVKSGVRAKLAQAAGVVVAQRAQVELFDPSLLGVPSAKAEHKVGAELSLFLC